MTPLRAGLDAHTLHDVRPGNVLAWPSNLGWMMGPWLLFAALLNGATIAVFEVSLGGTSKQHRDSDPGSL